MRRYQKWVLTLGIMAAAPGISMAGPFPSMFNLRRDNQPTEATQPETPANNQQVAEDIAKALRTAQLAGYDIEIKYQNGVATLTGMIADAQQRQKATAVVSKVPKVATVENQLQLISQSAGANSDSPVRSANLQRTERPDASALQQAGLNGPTRSMPADYEQGIKRTAIQNNQQTAEEIAGALSAANLKGFDIQIQCQNGKAILTGYVATLEQRTKATRIVAQVPGVQLVENQLRVPGKETQAERAAGHSAGYPYGHPGMPSPYQGVGYQTGQFAPPPGAMPPAAMMASQGGGHPIAAPTPGMPHGIPGQAASHTVYNSPQMSPHAWPSYAAYPNYAQVAYPKDYSASAWPYIGPFYPYPQVPLGWRQAQLEWDDGHWHLNFRPRTDRWWWFLNPKNW